jgi:bifunctional UDP-N-acetylglucosamine pyrophosphorylase / glucosamine-1-phosphate N-acetyltransferase
MSNPLSQLSVVILAAGAGKRMQSAQPKVLHRVAGKPMLQHVIDAARSLSAQQVIVIYGHQGEQVRAAFENQTDVLWAEQADQLGTGHAVAQALVHLPTDGVVLVLAGDVPLVEPATLADLVSKAAESNALGLLTQSLTDPTGYGRVVRDAANAIVGIVEHKDASAEQRAIREWYTGTMAIPATKLRGWLSRISNANAQGEYYLTTLVELAKADGVPIVAAAATSECDSQGVNSKVDLHKAERLFQARVAHQLLERGVTLVDASRVDVRGELTTGRDVIIDINCVFEGRVSLGDGVQVGAHCVLKDCSIASGTIIQPYSHIDGAQVAANVRIGPYARLRPGAQLGENVHVGNFVEVKQSTLARGAKANHLAYIGDATVGEATNIGAGTITCNYDGVNKHRTTIGSQVFVGSNSTLVAPVKIADGTFIAAGSAITDDTEPNDLAFGRARQSVKKGWKKPTKG